MSVDPSKDQIRHETKTHLARWTEETDLDDHEIAQCYLDAINEWLEDDVVEFDSEIDLDPDQD